MTMEFSILPLFKQTYVIKVSFKELNKVSPWALSANPKAKNTSWLVMSSVSKNQTSLSYVLKCS
jgi:hypothetical protein